MSAREATDTLLAQARQSLFSGTPDSVESSLSSISPEDPCYPDALHVRGVALAVSGSVDAAISLLEEAHRLKPDDVELAGNLAKALGRAKRYHESLRLNDELLCAGHRSVERYCDCGIMLLGLGKDAEALTFFNLALEADATNDSAWAGKATVLQRYRASEEALLCFDRAILLAPDNSAYRGNRASVLADLARFDEAMREHDLALSLDPLCASLMLNRAKTLMRYDRPKDALAAITRAHELAAADTRSLILQGDTLYELKRLDEAMQCYEAALRLDAECHEAIVKRGWMLISFGNYRDGWRDTEHRIELLMPQLRRHQHIPRWTGKESLIGKRVVVWTEQGHGDVIQYCRFALDLLALGAEVVLEVKPPLVALCASMQGCQVIALDAPMPPCDFQISIASLPHVLGIETHAVPHSDGYLRAPTEAVQRWAARLPPRRHALRIGIACSGYGGHGRNHMRSMPLRHFFPLTEYADLFLLQPALRHEDELFQQSHPEIERPQIEAASFADTAGLVQNMDLVISVDTSIAHLAASLGKETWTLLDWLSEWRWMHDVDYSPWYRSMKLFRQTARADWTSVIRQIVFALSARRQG